jgi:hypothetical protein
MQVKLMAIMAVITVACVFAGEQKTKPIDVQTAEDLPVKERLAHYQHLKEASAFIRKWNYDTSFAVLVNYGIHSGKKRLFLVNPSRGIAFDSFLVSHGCGLCAWGLDESREKAGFSNNSGSHCSSLGKYKLGKRAYSDWGINVKYMMHGLDTTNNNAFKRTIVLHGWGDVTDDEVYPRGTPEGWGCPAVSVKAMHSLDSILQKRKKPVLMWVFD